MPIKFSELPVKTIAETSKVIGLYTDNTSNTGVSNCLINTSDFAKQTKLTEVDESAVHIYDSERIIGDKTFIGKVYIDNTLSITQPMTTTSTINGVKPAASNSTSETLIPTIGWINDLATSTNLVHRSGAEEISGYKTFTNVGAPIRFKNNNLEQMVNPSAYSEQMVYGIDKNDIRIGSMGIGMDVNGNSRAYIAASKKIGDNYVYSILDTYVDKNGNAWTSAPTPASNDNSTKIATTAWVNSKIVAGTGGFPNYSAAAGRAQNTSYTAGTNGFLYIHIVRSNSSEGSIPITISGYTFTLRSNDYGHVYVMYPIAKGTTYSIGSQTKLSTVELTWFPAI